MKTIKTLCVLLLTGAFITGCSNDDNTENTPKAIRTYTLSVNATKGDDVANTRALTLEGQRLNATWAVGEHEYVRGTQGSSDKFWFKGSIQPESAGKSTRLNGEITVPDGWTYTTIQEAIDNHVIGYPLKLDLRFPRQELDYSGQVGTLADIAAKYDYAMATNVEFTVNGNHIEGSTDVTFENQQAIVKFTLKDKADGTTLLSPTTLTIEYGEEKYVESVSLTSIPADTYTTNGPGVLFVAIPGFESKDITLTATVAGNTYKYSKSGVTFDDGKYYDITVKMTKASA